MADSISQDTIQTAGLAPKPEQMIQADVMSAYGQKGAALKEKTGIQDNVARLNAEKQTALAPKMDEMAVAAREKSPEAPALERSPAYERPTLQPKEVQDAFGLLMAASMLVGATSRAPFYATMQAMTGALTGFEKKDEKLVEESLKSFNANMTALKERNDAARLEFDQAWKKYADNLPRLKQELEIIGAKYDLPIATENARVVSIDSAVKEFDNTIKSGETALIKLQQIGEKAENDRANREQRADAAADRNATMRAIAEMNSGAGAAPLTTNGRKVYDEFVTKGIPIPKTRRGQIDVEELNHLGEVETGGAGSGAVSESRQDAKTNQATLIDFTKGKPAMSIQSINAVTEHMETFRQLARALDNGDVQLYNKYKNDFKRAFGATLPNDIRAAAPIVGSEIVKAIVPTGGGVEERRAAQEQWDSALSKNQLESQIDNVFIPLMQGQASGLRQRYETTGRKDFEEKYFTPDARKILFKDKPAETAGTNTAAEDKEQADLERALGIGAPNAVKGKITPR